MTYMLHTQYNIMHLGIILFNGCLSLIAEKAKAYYKKFPKCIFILRGLNDTA